MLGKIMLDRFQRARGGFLNPSRYGKRSFRPLRDAAGSRDRCATRKGSPAWFS